MSDNFVSGVYTVDSYGRFRFAADRDRAEAALLDLVAGVLYEAHSFEQASRELSAVADAKRTSASLLDEMAAEEKNAPEGTDDVR